MIPKIDYKLLGFAVEHFEEFGYNNVEVPWLVEDQHILATLPGGASYLDVVERGSGQGPINGGVSCLVGSAEQGFLALNLPKARYMGVTPCFRKESKTDLFTRDYFMKLELHEASDEMSYAEGCADRMLHEVREYVEEHLEGHFDESQYKGKLTVEKTEIGFDLMLCGIEIGSFGARVLPDYGPWAYGTGLALPRFSVAAALIAVV